MVAPRSQFLTDEIVTFFTGTAVSMSATVLHMPAPQQVVGVNIDAHLREMWGN
jgi:hypothetical protein